MSSLYEISKASGDKKAADPNLDWMTITGHKLAASTLQLARYAKEEYPRSILGLDRLTKRRLKREAQQKP